MVEAATSGCDLKVCDILVWQNFRGVHVRPSTGTSVKNRYSVTVDILSYRRCARLYGFIAERGYVPSQPTQEFVGTVIHQVLDRAHAHYAGRVNPSTRGTIPTDQEIEDYFREVENALRVHGVRPIGPVVRRQTLRLVQVFNQVEGPVLYPRIRDTEHRLRTQQQRYILHGIVDVLAGSTTSSDLNDRDILGLQRAEETRSLEHPTGVLGWPTMNSRCLSTQICIAKGMAVYQQKQSYTLLGNWAVHHRHHQHHLMPY